MSHFLIMRKEYFREVKNRQKEEKKYENNSCISQTCHITM